MPQNWDITIESCGANTTFFVEKMLERNTSVSNLQATLLLLGIYEDAGSLMYSNTTPRDMSAAAYILEQGASLIMASDFLNVPISQKQRELYDQLATRAKSYAISGHCVIVACCDGNDISDEISSISQKSGDLFDYDALFILASASDGIQVIADLPATRLMFQWSLLNSVGEAINGLPQHISSLLMGIAMIL